MIAKTVAQQYVFWSFWLNLLNSAFANSCLEKVETYVKVTLLQPALNLTRGIQWMKFSQSGDQVIEFSGPTASLTLRTLIPFYNNCSYLVAGHIFSLAEPWFSRPFIFLDGEGFFPRILGEVLFIVFCWGSRFATPIPRQWCRSHSWSMYPPFLKLPLKNYPNTVGKNCLSCTPSIECRSDTLKVLLRNSSISQGILRNSHSERVWRRNDSFENPPKNDLQTGKSDWQIDRKTIGNAAGICFQNIFAFFFDLDS